MIALLHIGDPESSVSHALYQSPASGITKGNAVTINSLIKPRNVICIVFHHSYLDGMECMDLNHRLK